MRRLAWIGIALTMPVLAWAQSPGIELYKQGKFAEASKVLAGEVAKSPENQEALTYLGLARVQSGDPNGALDPLKSAVAKNGKNADAHYGLGLAYGKLKNLDQAITELETATQVAPDHGYAHYQLGMAYNQKGRKDLAIPHLRRFIELLPNAPEAPAVRSFLSKI